MQSPAARPVTLPAPSTTATPPRCGRSRHSASHIRRNAARSPGFAQRTRPRWPPNIARSAIHGSGITSTPMSEASASPRCSTRGGAAGRGVPLRAISSSPRAVISSNRSVAIGPVATSSATTDAFPPPDLMATAASIQRSAVRATASAASRAIAARAAESRPANAAAPARSASSVAAIALITAASFPDAMPGEYPIQQVAADRGPRDLRQRLHRPTDALRH